jgi:hypothetical protein
MTRPHDAKVAPVQRRQLRLAQTLDSHLHGGVHEADLRVAVTFNEFLGSYVISLLQVFDHICSGNDVGEKGHHDIT